MAAVIAHTERLLDSVAQAPAWSGGLPPDHEERLAVRGGGRDLVEVMAVVDELVDRSGVSTTSPRYLGYIPAGGLFASAVGDFLAALSNRYVGLASMAPGAAALDRVVVRWLADAVGMPDLAGGALTSGGSMATLTALVAARELAEVDLGRADRWVVYVGEHTHHCVPKALKVAGLGSTSRRVVPSDNRHRMDPAALQGMIEQDRANGLRPWLLVATAGTTSTGTVDPLADLAMIAEVERLWYHVDGAYGGLFALCPEGRSVLGGIERADTLVVDPHKTLFLPYGTGAVLARSESTLRAAFQVGADYLDDAAGDEVASACDLDLELTRPFRAMRVWLPLQLAGSDAFAAALSEKVQLARYAHAQLAELAGVQVGPEPDLAIATFWCDPIGGDGSEATQTLGRHLQRQGRVYVTGARVRGRQILRLAVGSHRTHREHVDEAVAAVADGVAYITSR